MKEATGPGYQRFKARMAAIDDAAASATSQADFDSLIDEAMDEVDDYLERERARERLEADRQWVRDVAPCPQCKAKVGERCKGRKRPLISNHKPRNALAVDPRWKPVPRG